MSEMKLPSFMQGEVKRTALGDAQEAYIEKFGHGSLAMEGIELSEQEWIDTLNACVEQIVRIDEYLSIGDIRSEDEI